VRYASTDWLLLQTPSIAARKAHQNRLAVVEQGALYDAVAAIQATARHAMMSSEEERKLLLAVRTHASRLVRQILALDAWVAIVLEVLLQESYGVADTVLSSQLATHFGSALNHLPTAWIASR